jgi:hypothetical protein
MDDVNTPIDQATINQRVLGLHGQPQLSWPWVYTLPSDNQYDCISTTFNQKGITRKVCKTAYLGGGYLVVLESEGFPSSSSQEAAVYSYNVKDLFTGWGA